MNSDHLAPTLPRILAAAPPSGCIVGTSLFYSSTQKIGQWAKELMATLIGSVTIGMQIHAMRVLPDGGDHSLFNPVSAQR